MNADTTDSVLHISEDMHASDYFIEALVAHCRLSPESVSQITETMHSRQISFEEAACDLNLVTPQDTADVKAWLQGTATRSNASPGIFERAVHNVRFANTTALTVRRGNSRLGSRLQHTNNPGNPRNEQISALRTHLMLLNDSSRRNNNNVFAFVGPGRYEGRSQLCAELAIAFAQLGRRTLLVDADLRHPCQHVLFSSGNEWGLSQALAQGEAPFLNNVEGLPQLTLLTSGPVPPNPLELLSQDRFERLAGSLSNQYDFILIDTPATSEYADALQIASVARRIVAVSRAGVTAFDDMKGMLRRLAMTDSAILGAD